MVKKKRTKRITDRSSTRDTAVRAFTLATEHIKDCTEFRKRLMRHLEDRETKVDKMHSDNQNHMDKNVGELRQALQVAGTERRQAFEQIQVQIDNLAQHIGTTDDKISEAEKENLQRDINIERKHWGRVERVYWAIGGALLSLSVFLLKEKFFP